MAPLFSPNLHLKVTIDHPNRIPVVNLGGLDQIEPVVDENDDFNSKKATEEPILHQMAKNKNNSHTLPDSVFTFKDINLLSCFQEGVDRYDDYSFEKYVLGRSPNISETDAILSSLDLALQKNEDIESMKVEEGVNINSKDINEWSVLHSAVYEKKDPSLIKYLVENGAEVNAKDKYLWSILHLAVFQNNCTEVYENEIHTSALGVLQNKNIQIIEFLIEKGADVNAKTNKSWSVLHHAIHSPNNIEIIKYLIKKGADVNSKDNDSWSVLHSAVYEKKDIAVIKCLVENGADVNAKDKYLWSVLVCAVLHKNDINVISYLVEKGADVNQTCFNENSVLYYAVCVNNDLEVINYLISQGANINAKNLEGCNIIHAAVHNKVYSNVMKYLSDQGVNEKSKDYAIQKFYNYRSTLESHYKSFNDLKNYKNTKQLLLFVIDIYNDCDFPKCIFEYDLNVCLENDDFFQHENKVLTYANEFFSKANEFIVLCIIVSLHISMVLKETFGEMLMKRPGIDLIESLVKQGANIHEKNNDAWSALHFAVQYNNELEVIKYLVNNGINVNAHDEDLNSVLHAAVTYKADLKIIEYLVSTKANINAKNKYLSSVLHTAVASHNKLNVIEYLVSNGADVNATNDKHYTVKTLAIRCDNLETYKFLCNFDRLEDIKTAVESNQLRILEFILQNEIQLDAKLLHIAIRNESFDALKMLIQNISPAKLLSVNSYDEDIFTIAERQGNEKIIDYLQYLKTQIQPKLEKRADTKSLSALLKDGIFHNIFDGNIIAGQGVHKTGGKRQKNHGEELMSGSILKLLLLIYKYKIPCKVSCENLKFGIFDDFVLECETYVLCIQFKSKSNPENLEISELFPQCKKNKKSNYDIITYYESFLKHFEVFERKFNLILWTNRPLAESVRMQVTQDWSLPVFITNAFKFNKTIINDNMNEFRLTFDKVKMSKKNLTSFEESMQAFFEKFYLVVDQEYKEKLNESIKVLIASLIDEKCSDVVYGLMKGEMQDWYIPDKDETGHYLTDEYLNYYFEGLKVRVSKQYTQIDD